MGMFQFLKQLNLTPPPGGDGVRLTRGLHILADLRTATGLVLDATTTTPLIAALETNAVGVSVAAGATAAGTFTFVVPAGYDAVADELKINVLAVSSGTDVPTLTATCYRKRSGVALATVTPTAASAAIPNTTAKAAWRTIDFTGRGFQPGDVLTINLVTGAHATHTVNIHGVEVQWKGHLIAADPANR